MSDSGTGFDVEAAVQDKGLSLTSMRAGAIGRVRMQSIRSPMGGTTIDVRVPLGSAHTSRPALDDRIHFVAASVPIHG